jgi:L-rhamnose mutarotase
MPYNSAFTPSTFAREGKKRSTYLTEFEKDLVSICNEQAASGGKRFKWHFFFIQDFDVANPEAESDIDYLILDKFNSAWKKKLAALLQKAPASAGVCKGRCWVTSFEEKSGDDKFYISIAGGISQVVIDGRENPATSTANKAIVVKALRKEWLKRLKIKAGEAEIVRIDESVLESGEKEDSTTEETTVSKKENIDHVKQKIKDFKAVSEDNEVEQIKALITLQEVLKTLPKTDKLRIQVQASVDNNFQEIEDEVAHATIQDYTHFQKEKKANVFLNDYGLASDEIEDLNTFFKQWEEVVNLMKKEGVKSKTDKDLTSYKKIIEEEIETLETKVKAFEVKTKEINTLYESINIEGIVDGNKAEANLQYLKELKELVTPF